MVATLQNRIVQAPFTAAQFEEEVRKLVAEFPNARYQKFARTVKHRQHNCSYAYGKCDNGPKGGGCIFGRVFRRLGIPQRKVRGFDQRKHIGISHILAGLHVCGVGGPVAVWAGQIQVNQDRGLTWGEALADADTRYPLKPAVTA